MSALSALPLRQRAHCCRRRPLRALCGRTAASAATHATKPSSIIFRCRLALKPRQDCLTEWGLRRTTCCSKRPVDSCEAYGAYWCWGFRLQCLPHPDARVRFRYPRRQGGIRHAVPPVTTREPFLTSFHMSSMTDDGLSYRRVTWMLTRKRMRRASRPSGSRSSFCP